MSSTRWRTEASAPLGSFADRNSKCKLQEDGPRRRIWGVRLDLAESDLMVHLQGGFHGFQRIAVHLFVIRETRLLYQSVHQSPAYPAAPILRANVEPFAFA